jgi:nucleoside-specific outer membrane channel protein Tsx
VTSRLTPEDDHRIADALCSRPLGKIIYHYEGHVMSRLHLTIAMLFSLSVSAVHAADFSDTWLGLRYGTSFREPFAPNKIQKEIVSLNHFSGYKYGSNFFNVDLLNSDSNNLATGGGGGAHNVYVTYRHTLSLSAISGTPMKFPGVRDVGITGGFEWGVANDQFAGRTRKLVLGPKVSFDVPGFLDLALVARTERNHNWFATAAGFGGAGCTGICNPDVTFKTAPGIEVAWLTPFTAGLPAKFQGFMSWTGQKGRDGLGAETKPETLLELSVLFDVGSVAGRNGAVFAGVGYQYWKNKYGNNSANDPTGGSTARVPQLLVEAHF